MNKNNIKKVIRYLMVKDGKIIIDYTSDFLNMMKREFNYFFDTTDNLFKRYEDIRIFVKDESFFDEIPSIEYYVNNSLYMTFNGTVFFAKLGTYDVKSLSDNEILFLVDNLKDSDDGLYKISYES